MKPPFPKSDALTEATHQPPVKIETPKVAETPKKTPRKELAPKTEPATPAEEKARVEAEKPATPTVITKGTEPKETREETSEAIEKQETALSDQQTSLPVIIVNEAPSAEDTAKAAAPLFKSPKKINPNIRALAQQLNLFGSKGPSTKVEEKKKIGHIPEEIRETEKSAKPLSGLTRGRPKGPNNRQPKSRAPATTAQPLETSDE